MEMTKALSDYIDKHAALEAETKRVSKSEFEEFLSAYPRPLVRDVFGACDPPAVSYNDFELGYWPRSIVAAPISTTISRASISTNRRKSDTFPSSPTMQSFMPNRSA